MADVGGARRTTVQTSGGSRLRSLRVEHGHTQLSVELEAELGTGYLQRLESGKVVQPARRTLERIMLALDATYNERQQIMAMFGYRTPTTPPSEREFHWAQDLAAPQLRAFPYPAYALDCLHRLVHANLAATRLLGIERRPGEVPGSGERSILEEWFDERSDIGRMVANPEQFLGAMVAAFRYEIRRFQEEEWSQQLVDRMRNVIRFESYWRETGTDVEQLGASRALVPLDLQLSNGDCRRFRLATERFIDDARFRVVYYFPDDVTTMKAMRGDLAR